MIQIHHKLTAEMERLRNQKCGNIPEARSSTYHQYWRDPRVGALENLILPSASNQANKITRRRRDRLLTDSECEAA